MAEINIGEIVDHLSTDLRKALAAALEEVGGKVLNDIYLVLCPTNNLTIKTNRH